jgi:hypothetical protein
MVCFEEILQSIKQILISQSRVDSVSPWIGKLSKADRFRAVGEVERVRYEQFLCDVGAVERRHCNFLNKKWKSKQQ